MDLVRAWDLGCSQTEHLGPMPGGLFFAHGDVNDLPLGAAVTTHDLGWLVSHGRVFVADAEKMESYFIYRVEDDARDPMPWCAERGMFVRDFSVQGEFRFRWAGVWMEIESIKSLPAFSAEFCEDYDSPTGGSMRYSPFLPEFYWLPESSDVLADFIAEFRPNTGAAE